MKRTLDGHPYQQVKYQGLFGQIDEIKEFHIYAKRRLVQKDWSISGSGANTMCNIEIKKSVVSENFFCRICFGDLNDSGSFLGSKSGFGSLENMKALIEVAITNGTEKEVYGADYDPDWYDRILDEFQFDKQKEE